jgi:DegV family protein with EDD domain
MAKILISTDSSTSLTKSELDALKIKMIPLNVIIDNIEYHDGIDIDAPTLIKKMRDGNNVKTSTPSIAEVHTYFDNLMSQGYDHIIHLTISSKLSSIYSMFTLQCQERYGDKVTIVDSLSAASFMGSLVKYAAKLNNGKAGVAELIRGIEERKTKEAVWFIPETLTYLKRGGRISPAAAAVGNLLGIKPVLRFVNGAIEKGDTTRSVKQYLPKIFEEIKANYPSDKYELHLINFDNDLVSKIIKDSCESELPKYNIISAPMALNVGAHTGPGTIGIGVALKP